MKRYFVFSDIHGHLKPLIEALDKIGFSMDNEDHILISLGDNFDRGNENLLVYGYLRHFKNKGRLIMIRGNHDDFLLDFLTGKSDGLFNIKYNGFGTTLVEFADQKATSIDLIRDSINQKFPTLINFLESMVDTFQLGNYIFTHAGLTYDTDKGWYIYNFSKMKDFIQTFDPRPYTYVFGHTHAKSLNLYELGINSNEIFYKEGFIGIDANTTLSKTVHVLVFDEAGNLIG